ncbi:MULTISPECIES: TetR/AcrR family transcriptional regulator [unclassified Beijerinckia]|uniref:TetR/AcrR family transcriptional regulator n=1 Tax=unclassified Beijerinckia TaxID=2638183 RepID=UPI00089CE3C2|nr:MULTISPECIES: TetR/AcrR family transcriptional regulator [unclassified Beijerinckia]MDH7794596.1 AcrR family transcriptional regulator [Beijerinckia sp. GAS462]SEB67920.1 transcriptional regulator, TetR family [Beijerinckia sp. 28-YEA-48]
MSTSMPPSDDPLSSDTRARIIAAAAALVAAGGSEAATTRAVANAASVQAPTIYRLFGDKRGLLDAVAEETFSNYVAGKAQRARDGDPVEDLRLGWDAHVAFGLANPAIFTLISATYPEPLSRTAAAGMAVLRERVRRVARTGRLRVSEERAVDLIHAMGTGTVLTLLEKAPNERAGLAEAARNAVFAAILDERSGPVAGASSVAGTASALRARLDEVTGLTPGEQLLLDELLRRIAGAQ